MAYLALTPMFCGFRIVPVTPLPEKVTVLFIAINNSLCNWH